MVDNCTISPLYVEKGIKSATTEPIFEKGLPCKFGITFALNNLPEVCQPVHEVWSCVYVLFRL